MQIVCNQCGSANEIPANTPVGAPIACSRCGNAGRFTGSPRAAKPAKGSVGFVAFVALGLLVASCVGSIFAMALPWPTLVVAFLTLLVGVLMMSGRVTRDWRGRWVLGVGSAVVSVGLIGLAALSVFGAHQQEVRDEEAAAAAVEAERRRVDEVRQQAAARIARAREHLEGAELAIQNLDGAPMQLAAQELQPLAELDPRPDGYDELTQRVIAANAQLARTGARRYLDEATLHADAVRWAEVRTALGNASPHIAALGAEGAEFQQRQAALQARAGAFWAATSAVERAQSALDTDHADAMVAEAVYDRALAGLDAVQGEALDANAREIRGLRRRLERARRRNHRAAERLGRVRAARAAQRQRCGTAPALSPWDGELIGSESYLGRSAHDPDSIDVEHCTVPSLTVNTTHCWVSTCDVLGRNAFGAMVRSRMQFEVRSGRIVSGTRVR